MSTANSLPSLQALCQLFDLKGPVTAVEIGAVAQSAAPTLTVKYLMTQGQLARMQQLLKLDRNRPSPPPSAS